MCGRYVLLTDLQAVAEAFHIGQVACDYRTGNRFLPGQQVAAVVCQGDRNLLVNFRWGLLPAWAKDPAMGRSMFNARAETVAVKPSFKDAFRKRRCLIIADGFYEWQKTGTRSRPVCFRLKSRRPFGFAGLYETWVSPDQQAIHTCTIITTEANELIRPVHDRMPVIIESNDERTWLAHGSAGPPEWMALLKPYPAAWMDADAAISH